MLCEFNQPLCGDWRLGVGRGEVLNEPAELTLGRAHDGSDVCGGSCAGAAGPGYLKTRDDTFDDPVHWEAAALGAQDHRIAFAFFGVARRPHPPDDNVSACSPQEQVIEAGQTLSFVELVPPSRIDVAADALCVKEALDANEEFRFEAEIVHVVVPARVFAEGAQEHPYGIFLIILLVGLLEEALKKWCHRASPRLD